MSIWNPYTFTRGGAPAQLGATPPALRVVGGPATATQLAAARMAFNRFCGVVRTSPVPNPSEIGSLADGTRYQITVVGPSATMTIWPVPPDAVRRGVGVSTAWEGGRDLFIVTHINGKWTAKSVPEFYGGQRVWVALNGLDYFADNTWNAAPVSAQYLPRRYSAVKGDLTLGDEVTTILDGVGYANANAGVGIITPAGRYAQIHAEAVDGVVAVEVADVSKVPEAAIKSTPEVPAAIPVPRQSLVLESADRLELVRSVANGSSSNFRLRSGQVVGFPLFNLDVPVDDWAAPRAATDPHLSPKHIEGAAIIAPADAGGYAVSFESAGVDLRDTMGRSQPILWQLSRTRRQADTFGVGYLSLALPWDRYGVLHPEPCGGADTRVLMPREYPYEISTMENHFEEAQECQGDMRRLVYLSSDWEDQKVAITAYGEMTLRLSRTTDEQFTNHDNLLGPDHGNVHWSVADGAGMVHTYFLTDYGAVLPDPPAGRPFTTEIKRSERCRIFLDTPWGVVTHKDVNLTYASTQTPPGGLVFTIQGVYRKNHVIHVDPVIGIVAYLSVFADQFAVPVVNQVTVTSGYVELVVLARGRQIFAKKTSFSGEQFNIPLGTPESIEDGPWVASTSDTLANYPDIKTSQFFSCAIGDVIYDATEASQGTRQLKRTSTTMHSSNARTITRNAAPIDFIPVSVPLGDYRVLTAVDPNSGGGVVLASIANEVVGAFAVDRKGGAINLMSLLPARQGSSLNPMAFSV